MLQILYNTPPAQQNVLLIGLEREFLDGWMTQGAVHIPESQDYELTSELLLMFGETTADLVRLLNRRVPPGWLESTMRKGPVPIPVSQGRLVIAFNTVQVQHLLTSPGGCHMELSRHPIFDLDLDLMFVLAETKQDLFAKVAAMGINLPS